MLHGRADSLSDWVPMGIEVIQIIGTGLDTPSSIFYTSESSQNCTELPCPDVLKHQIHFSDGDDRVVSASAIGQAFKTFYFHLESYNHPGSVDFRRKHFNIM